MSKEPQTTTSEAPKPIPVPRALDEDVWAKLVEALQNGAARDDAAASAGVGERTFYRWLADGKRQQREMRKADPMCDPPEGSLWHLRHEVKKAEAHFRTEGEMLIRRHALDSWQAMAWLLERKHPDRYGRRLDVGGVKGGAPIKTDGSVKGIVVLPVLDDTGDEVVAPAPDSP